MATLDTFLSILRGILNEAKISYSPAILLATLTYVATLPDF